MSTDNMSRFLDHVAKHNLLLYPAQEEAVLEIFGGKNVILNTPTGSGKSLVALAMHFKALQEGKRCYYTSPIKALASEKFFSLCQDLGAQHVGMMTGDASINRDAPIICCTAEILSNMALSQGEKAAVDYVVMDEFHYYADKDRGAAWQIPLLTLPQATFLLMSATMGDCPDVVESLKTLTGKEVVIVRSNDRPVPLDFEYRENFLHETIVDLVTQKKYPIYLVNFTQRECVEEAQNALSLDICSKEDKQKIVNAMRGFRFDSPFGKDMRRFLAQGVGLHHAGLLPKYRLLVEKLAQEGMLRVIMGTDTLGVGVNIPIRSVLFTKLCKFDGEKVGVLRVREFKQIAGRAGRKGFDTQGSVVCLAPEHVVDNKRIDTIADPKKRKKMVKKKPPEKGYVFWDGKTFERLIHDPPEALQSQFTVTHGMMMTILQGSETPRVGYQRLIEIIKRSHEKPRAKSKLRRLAKQLFKSLVQAGVVQIIKNRQTGTRLQINTDLQHDFSLHHTLSLYLHETLPLLDATTETYALDALTLVEAILEPPSQVLYKQVDKLKDEKMAEMKAAGMEYDDRIAELEKIDFIKPNAEFVYATFNAFAEKHPWVGQQNIQPKSVARDMFERCCSFHEYIREYGLQRSEGVLLRYLTQVYKAVVQNVPAIYKNDPLEEIQMFLRVMLGRVDSSLVDEWEQMLNPQEEAEVALPKKAQPYDPKKNFKAFAARVRAEMHRLVKALAQQDYEEAVLLVRRESEDEWTEDKFKQAIAPYYAEYPGIDTTPRARAPEFTIIKELKDKHWQIQQVLVDPNGDNQWMLQGRITIDDKLTADDPWIYLERIGI
jgi:superfamily II RNA helicase